MVIRLTQPVVLTPTLCWVCLCLGFKVDFPQFLTPSPSSPIPPAQPPAKEQALPQLINMPRAGIPLTPLLAASANPSPASKEQGEINGNYEV